MAAFEKLVRRFKSVPSDFTWDELVRLLHGLGYQEQMGAGSRRKFKGGTLPMISIHEPHPGNIVKRYALRDVKSILEAEGLI